jgi:hypothetical protein
MRLSLRQTISQDGGKSAANGGSQPAEIFSARK